MKKAAITMAAVALLAQGCVSTPSVVETEVREVERVVLVRCVEEKSIPRAPSTSMDPKGDVKQKAAGAAVDVEELRLYAGKLRALLLVCAK